MTIYESEDEDSYSLQFDDNGNEVPSSPCCSQWVQCDNARCQKWRRIDYSEDVDVFVDAKWMCDMNKGISLNILITIMAELLDAVALDLIVVGSTPATERSVTECVRRVVTNMKFQAKGNHKVWCSHMKRKDLGFIA